MVWIEVVINSSSSHPTPNMKIDTVLALISHVDCLEASHPVSPTCRAVSTKSSLLSPNLLFSSIILLLHHPS